MRPWPTLALGALVAICPARAFAAEYALSMFHFNVQYVAGGLVGFPAFSGEQRPAQTEDAIIEESLLPVLELYAAHPTWGVTIEMQGYLLDVMAARHPEGLALLRDMAMSGQAEVVSFHYSDQLFIGYPEVDWARSQALTAATFASHDVPLGTSVFCQEGQSGEAMAEHMAALGYETMIWPKNLWIEQHGEFDAEPLYRFGDVNLVVGAKGASYDDGVTTIETSWTFFDDGELLATGDWNPYFPELFFADQEVLDAYEADLMAREAAGALIVTVADYVAAIEDDVTLAEPPPLLDGTWQPGSTNGVAKWMGDRSLWALSGPPHDRDNHVRTLGYVAHRELTAAETAAAVAGLDAREALDAAWRMLALGQVTDATGINPYRGEVEYGITHLAEATRIARDVIKDAKAAQGWTTVTISPRDGTMTEGDAMPLAGTSVDTAPVTVDTAADDPARTITTTWEELAPNHHRVSIAFGAGETDMRNVSATFRGVDSDEIVTTRALADDEIAAFARDAFSFGSWQLALPLGLVGLGPDLFLVKDTGHVHLAAGISPTSPDVTFRDETQAGDEAVTWVFHVVEGSADEALAIAKAVNSERTVVR